MTGKWIIMSKESGVGRMVEGKRARLKPLRQGKSSEIYNIIE